VEPWRSDGTVAGTYMLTDIESFGGSFPGGFFAGGNGIVYFHDLSSDLWKTDGTSPGTARLLSFDLAPSDFHRLGTGATPCVLFQGYTSSTGRELWRSDGTPAGTFLLADISSGVSDSLPASFTALDAGTSLFTAVDATHGRELWRTDGTVSGTFLVKDILPGSGSSAIETGVTVDGTHYFSADDGVHGRELWKTDGTPAGTTLVQDIVPGPVGSMPMPVAAAHGRVYFTAEDAIGRELWTSDGTAAGTFPLDLAPGPPSSDPQLLSTEPGRLYLSVFHPDLGREPWVLDDVDEPTLSVLDAAVREGDNGVTLAGFRVTLSAPSAAPVTVDFATQPGTAAAGTDYTTASGQLVFPPGTRSRSVVVSVLGDTAAEGDETFTLTLSAPRGAALARSTAGGTIEDDDTIGPAPASLTVYRLFLVATGEHLYTTDRNEYDTLGGRGWIQEGATFRIFDTAGYYNSAPLVPYYRLYCPLLGQHLWTSSANEAFTLNAGGLYDFEGIIGYLLADAVPGSTPLYRLVLPSPFLHLWTIDRNEYDTLGQRGWTQEDVVGHVLP